MSEHSQKVKQMIVWVLEAFGGPHARTIPVDVIDALVERSENSADFLIEIRDRLPAGGGASELTLQSVVQGIAGANAWLEAILDAQHGDNQVIALQAIKTLLEGSLTTQAGVQRLTESTAPLAAAGTFTGPSRAAPAGTLRGLAIADVAGTLYLDVSTDGNAPWMRVASQIGNQAGGAGPYVASIEHAPVLGYFRWVYVNDAAGQASFCLGTALVST